jgi:hypothetical protein
VISGSIHKKLIALVAVLAAPFVTANVQAGTGLGKITYFVSFNIGGSEAFVVRLDSMSPAGCATGNRFVLTDTDRRFKTITAMIMGAHYCPIRLIGAGSCSLYVGSEDLAYACMGDDPC